MLEATDLPEPLAVVLTPVLNPMKSRLYPVDMCSLLAYDRKSLGTRRTSVVSTERSMFEVETVKALVRDYDLVDSDEFEENIRTFLTHIGESYTLCCSPRAAYFQSTHRVYSLGVHADCIPPVNSVGVPAKPSGEHCSR